MSLKEITARETADHVHAHFKTTLGDFTVELLHKGAPKTCQNFIDLAEGTTEWTHPRTGGTKKNTPFYDGLTFHRIIEGFMIQGGCPAGNGRGNPGYRFADEFNPALTHDGPGVLSMANSGPDSNGSQFFITLGATPHLDGRHAVFGKVVAGLDVISKLGSVRTGPGDQPVSPVKIESLTIARS
jgi:peptidyl-prolyl cis-trans isomerase A (cyclophilin A)